MRQICNRECLQPDFYCHTISLIHSETQMKINACVENPPSVHTSIYGGAFNAHWVKTLCDYGTIPRILRKLVSLCIDVLCLFPAKY